MTTADGRTVVEIVSQCGDEELALERITARPDAVRLLGTNEAQELIQRSNRARDKRRRESIK